MSVSPPHHPVAPRPLYLKRDSVHVLLGKPCHPDPAPLGQASAPPLHPLMWLFSLLHVSRWTAGGPFLWTREQVCNYVLIRCGPALGQSSAQQCASCGSWDKSHLSRGCLPSAVLTCWEEALQGGQLVSCLSSAGASFLPANLPLAPGLHGDPVEAKHILGIYRTELLSSGPGNLVVCMWDSGFYF